jgi:WD40-like Beta Propeller Repeat
MRIRGKRRVTVKEELELQQGLCRRAALSLALVICAIALILPVSSAQGAASAPVVTATSFTDVTTSAVRFEATVNPGERKTEYRFEYLTEAAYETNPVSERFAGASLVPVPDAVIEAELTVDHPVAAEAKGLTPGTAYRFRLHASNSKGDTDGETRAFATYIPPPIFSGCSNEALRTENPAAARVERQSSELPDCRAYEQASPVDKDGGDVTATPTYARAAIQGGAIGFVSVSGVPGGVGSQDIPSYLASREGGDWITRGLLPPATAGQLAKVLGWTPDFSNVYGRANQLGDPPMIAMLASAGPSGPLSTVADYAPEANYLFAGASEGGATVLYETGAKFEGTLQGTSSLYAWDRASGQRTQVDLFNDETSPVLGAFAGSYDWVKGTTPTSLTQGGALREYYTQAQHAFATDGSAAYFTEAGTGQLHVRLNPTAPQSAMTINGEGEEECEEEAMACTLHVSASHKTDGDGVEGHDAAGPAPAAFMAASANGQKAFFTSSEKLTNDANTGPEQEPAAVMRSDKEGNGRAICAAGHDQAVAVDAGHVYWIDLETGAIGRAKIGCTDVEAQFIAPAQLEVEQEGEAVTVPANPRGLAVGNGHLYWANAADEEGEGTIGRATLNGEGPATGVDQEFIEEAGNPQGVAVDTGHVYWTDSSTSNTDNSFIAKATIEGTEAQPELIGVGKASLVGIAVDGERIYWMRTEIGGTPNPGHISRAKKLDGSEYQIGFIFLGENNPNGQGLALEGTRLYWAAQGLDAIGRAKLNGAGAASEEQPEFIQNAGHPKGLAVDASNLYWTANAEAAPNPGKDLYRYDTEAKSLIDLAPDSSEDGSQVRGVLGVSPDGSYAYFAANGVPDDLTGSPNARGESAAVGNCPANPGSSTAGTCNLYLWHEGEVRFIARLQVGSGATDSTNWLTTPSGVFTGATDRTSRVSADGKTLLFRSARQLTEYENEGAPELYLYRAESGQLGCVSCNPTGMAPDRHKPTSGYLPGFGSVNIPVLEPDPPAATLSYNLSADGKRVLFEGTDALAVEDTNGEGGCPPVGTGLQEFPACTDVYEWEAQGAGSCSAARAVAAGGCLYLLSTGKGTQPALIADASGDGGDVFFFSRSRLVGQDEDALQDVYDVRANGGLAAQNPPPPPPPCEGSDACRPHGSQPTPVAPPPSFEGPGNPKAKPARCPKGKRRVKGHCTKKRAHKRPRHHRRSRER